MLEALPSVGLVKARKVSRCLFCVDELEGVICGFKEVDELFHKGNSIFRWSTT